MQITRFQMKSLTYATKTATSLLLRGNYIIIHENMTNIFKKKKDTYY